MSFTSIQHTWLMAASFKIIQHLNNSRLQLHHQLKNDGDHSMFKPDSLSNSPSSISVPIKPLQLKPLHLLQLPSLSTNINNTVKLDLDLALIDESAMVAETDTLTLANPPTLPATDASIYKVIENELEKCCQDTSTTRRKRRRKRVKKRLETEEENGGEVNHVSIHLSPRKSKSRYLTTREEAECSLCLKEKTRLEGMRSQIAKQNEVSDISLEQWARAAGINRRSLDRKLCYDRESRQRLCQSFRRLVISVANSYQGRGLTLQDLIQEGSIGLLRGAERFDPQRGYKLSTYVYWWIKQAIVRAIAIKSRAVRLPGSVCDKVPKIVEAGNVLGRRLQRHATYDEIAEALDMSVSIVRLVSEKSRPAFSLDGAPAGQDSLKLQDILAGPEEITPEKMVKKQILNQTVQKLLKTLSNREENILRLRYELGGNRRRSFEEIGRIVKLSRERVRQLKMVLHYRNYSRQALSMAFIDYSYCKSSYRT